MTESLSIEPSGGGTDRKPGDTLELRARWELAEPPRSLEARLFWFTQGKGSRDIGVVEVHPIDVPEASGERRVKFRLPDAPYSFSGQLITLTWAVELVANGSDDVPVGRWEFVLAPDGQEIQLPDAGVPSLGNNLRERLAARIR